MPRRLTRRFRARRRPDLTVRQILEWCDEFHALAKRWPTRRDGSRGGRPRGGVLVVELPEPPHRLRRHLLGLAEEGGVHAGE